MYTRIKGIILFLAIIIATITICISAAAKPNIAENTSSNEVKVQYLLSEFKGKLAIYKTNSNTPIEVLNVQINSLPERDIERLKTGITANTLSEIIALAEDYE